MAKWEIKSDNLKQAEQIAVECNVPVLLASILASRGITKKQDVETFLNPTRDDFYDPFEIIDMAPAVERCIKAINENEKVCIYGDYDVDGITSVTVLKNFFKDRGLEVGYYIPNRLDEGYGLNKQAIEKIANDGYTLIITVDCGISSKEEVAYAYSLGLEVIVTDHHEPPKELPECIAVVDCKRKDCTYKSPNLAGVGVSFKLIQAISKKLNLDDKEYLKYLDIVCIGTISDIVPLTDENRVIAKLGLKLIAQTHNIGLRELIKSCGFSEINSSSVSFGIAPRINACGRMGHEQEAIKLFLTDDAAEAKQITESLNKYNRERQDIEKKIYDEAIELIEKRKINNNCTIIVGKKDWHHGVIGIVSSKITDKYFKPSILVSFDGDEAAGSGRSIPGFDLHDALDKTSSYLEKYGGHSMACGLSMKKSNFEDFISAFEQVAKSEDVDKIEPIIYIDKEITSKDMTIEIIDTLKLLEPFGEANPVPFFVYKNLKVESIRALSEGKHLKLDLKDGNTVFSGIGFNMGDRSQDFKIGDKIDAVGMLEINEYNGYRNIQLNLKDIRKSY
jgi:single-stranded-DNA-specific exonuclease